MIPAFPDLGPHAGFIWAAYAVTFVAVASLTLYVVGDDRRQRRLLAELERRGVTRRSSKPAAPVKSASSEARAKPPAKAKPRSAAKRKPTAKTGARSGSKSQTRS
jgi:heme exporter protein D